MLMVLYTSTMSDNEPLYLKFCGGYVVTEIVNDDLVTAFDNQSFKKVVQFLE